jgi:manganese transport protein
MLYIAMGILGATVMPHNLYLHSSIVQTRLYELNSPRQREAIKFANDRFDLRAHVRALHQRRDSDRFRGDSLFAGRNDVAEIGDAYKL